MTVDTWSIVEDEFDVANNRHYEGLMAIGSGTLQQRASLEEGLHDDPQDIDYLRVPGHTAGEGRPRFKRRVGTYMPGVTGRHTVCGDQMINLPALHGLKIYTAEQRLEMEGCRIGDFSRRLDLRNGHLIRTFVWHTPGGARLAVRFERFISAHRRHVMALRCTIEHLDGPPVELRFLGSLSAEVRTNGFDHFESVDITGEHEPITLAVRTDSGIEVAAAALMTCDHPIRWAVEVQSRWVALCGGTLLDPGRTMRVEKYAAMTSTRHVSGPPVDVARKLAWEAASSGFDRLAQESDAVWQRRWEASDVQIEGDPESQRALRVSLYHLLRSAVEEDARCAIDTRAAAGEEHGGHCGWDSEMYALPVFLYTRPDVGRTLARFRHMSLGGARRNARRAGYPGARFAWASAPSGDEQCADRWHADHAVHVTAAVAYGLFHAHLCNPSDAGLLGEATEVLIETARYWCERVSPAPDGSYELLMVTGPDEYTPFSRNNAYTNRLVAFALSLTGLAWQKLERADPQAAAALGEQLGLQEREFARFTEVSAGLRLPYDENRRLVLQADDFFARQPLDLERHWLDRSRPLAETVSRERLYRSRALQRADAIQLVALFPHEFDAEQMRVAYETYAPLTSHDASDSRAVHALVAARIGQSKEAYRLWRESVAFDLQPARAADGVHADCAGANWQAVILGFAGMRTRMQSEILYIDPHLPETWTALRFPFVWDNQPLWIEVEPKRVRISHKGDRPLILGVGGQPGRLEPEQTIHFDLAG